MKNNFTAALAAIAAIGSISSAEAQDGLSAQMMVDHRGLIEIPGILRGNSDTHWGAANLVVFGPSWNYSAQDYALKNIKRSGGEKEMSLSGDLSVGGTKVRVEQSSKMIKREDGGSALQMNWRIKNPDETALNVQKAFVQFPFAANNFGGSKVVADGGEEAVLPLEPEKIRAFYGTGGITIKGKTAQGKDTVFRLSGKALNIEIEDGRVEDAKQTAYLVRVLLPNTKAGVSSEVVFEVSASLPAFANVEGEGWVAFPFVNDAKPGSILDFSGVVPVDAPAGKHGRIVNKDGHYAFEKTGKRVRLVGANLCFGANFLEKEECDALALQFRRMGYNTVRFHHTDVSMMSGGWDIWNAKKTPVNINPAQLDKLDYMFAAMKKAGLYITFDLYAMGLVDVGGSGVRGELKALMPIDDEVFNGWARNVLLWMNHVNPYTGIAWKDDPAIVNICPVNEDSIAAVWSDAKDRYNALFDEWKRTDPAARDAIAAAAEGRAGGRNDEQLRARFLTELKVEANKKLEKFLRDNGIKTMLSGSNWFNTMAQTFERDGLDVVDHHQYADHPVPHYLPRRYNQRSTMQNANPTYMTPIMMAPNRVFGKPFIVTEYNFCPPNRYRAEAGAMMGAYASLQDWDALYRFAWAHEEKNIREQRPIDGFDAATDPVTILTERQIVLLYGRGDVAPARARYVYAVNMDEATEKGVGDMWARGLFPHAFNAMALVSQIGSQVADGDRALQGKFTAAIAENPPSPARLSGNNFTAVKDLPKITGLPEIASDTGELALNNKQGTLRITTPKTLCIATPEKRELTAGGLTIRDATTFCSVSASAMDDREIAASRRILLFHITNVLTTDMQFTDDTMTMQHSAGKLPYLAKTGSVAVTLKNANANLKLYPLQPNGVRLPAIPAAYANGAYAFTLAIAPGSQNPTMMYELAP